MDKSLFLLLVRSFVAFLSGLKREVSRKVRSSFNLNPIHTEKFLVYYFPFRNMDGSW